MKNLLTPRYEVIADYPNSPFEVGDVRTWQEIKIISDVNPEKYPHIFREMQWYEGLTEEEMPKYLKHSNDGINYTYHKVNYWDLSGEYPTWESDFEHGDFAMWTKEAQYQPATEQEYNERLYKPVIHDLSTTQKNK